MSSSATNPLAERSLGFWREDEQEAFSGAVLAIAGAGGDGGEFAQMAARAGFGEIRLADPDPFDEENKNRQAFCDDTTIGVNKAVAVGEGIQRINKDLRVVTFTDGVTPDNIDEFVYGADVVIDETEFMMHWLGVMIARAARNEGVHDLMGMNVGFAGTVTGFSPEGLTFEDMLGIDPRMPLEEVEQQEIGLDKWLPYVPEYGDIDMFQKVAAGQKSAPSVQVGVGVAASMLTVETQLAVLHSRGISNNRRGPIQWPAVRFMDAMTGESGTITEPAASHHERLMAMFAANQAGTAPKVSY
jgi:molybdopterin/thiamine biosynthesis adenylyltransferase